LFDRQSRNISSITHARLPDLDYLLGYHFGYRVTAVDKADGPQCLLVGRRQAADLLRFHRHVLQ
jgi:hypothetical protein